MSWESRDYSHLEAGHVSDSDASDADSDVDPDSLSQSECSRRFMDYLVDLKLRGDLSAKAVCVLSFWAKRGGLVAPGNALALSPTRSGGAFSAHFDKVLGIDISMQQNWYNILVPGHSKHDVSRSAQNVAVQLPHEAIASELAETPHIFRLLEASVGQQSWCKNYMDHPVVRMHGAGKVLPIGIYVDGVQYQRRNGTVAFWCINLVTQRRHLILALQKRDFCRCGCRGYCSIFPALSVIEWSVASMVAGSYPSQRHDHRPWGGDVERQSTGGKSLGYFAVPIIMKGDWAEFAGTFCFRTWSHHMHPCFRCQATGGPDGSMRNHCGLSVLDSPWESMDMTKIEQACSACEITVVVSNAYELSLIAGNLHYDRRRAGSHGRALTCDLFRFGLQKGDRLEPSATVPDIGAVDTRGDFPFELVFWRCSMETIVKHRCPIFSRRSWILPDIICVDELHTMHLGIFQDYILAVVWQAFDADVWQCRGHLPDDAYFAQAALRLRAELFKWYREERIRNPTQPLHQLGDLQLQMLGTREHKQLHAKAAESGTLVRFAYDLAVRHRTVLGSALVHCGSGLMQYLEVTRSSSAKLTDTERQRIADGILRFLSYRAAAGVEWKPKAHLSAHMIADLDRFGNPLCTGTWLDEGLNHQLASICRTAHAAVWSRRILASFANPAGPAVRAARLASKKPRR
jgi:hypothetical protein